MVAYCEVGDLRRGDIPLPGYMSNGQQYVDRAAEEIDAAIGHEYKTPVVIDLQAKPQYRPTLLLLKKINWLLASGRLVLDLAAAGEDSDLHAYGRHMLREGLELLTKVSEHEIVLTGAARIEPADGEKNRVTGPTILNVDPASRVEEFYDRLQPVTLPYPPIHAQPPYGGG